MDNRPIGLMDSGLGGLSVGRVLQRQMPNESLTFLGDQGRFPYGTRPQSEVRTFAMQIGRFLTRQGIKLLVIACNTMTAAALPDLQTALPVPVIGVIEPGAKGASEVTHDGRIGVIATESTTHDGAYVRAIHELAPQATVVSLAPQPLVSVVEHGQAGTPAAQRAVDHQLAPLVQHPVDVLVLGCTHFPFLTKEIRQTLGTKVKIVDPAIETVKMVQATLAAQGQLAASDHQVVTTLYTTGPAANLKQEADRLLPRPAEQIRHVDIRTLEGE